MYPTVWTTLTITTSVPKSGCRTQTTNGKGPTPWAGNYTLQVGFLGMYV